MKRPVAWAPVGRACALVGAARLEVAVIFYPAADMPLIVTERWRPRRPELRPSHESAIVELRRLACRRAFLKIAAP